MKRLLLSLLFVFCVSNAWAVDGLPSCVDSHIKYAGYDEQSAQSQFPGTTTHNSYNPNCNRKWYTVTVTGANYYFHINNCISCKDGSTPYQLEGNAGLPLDDNGCNFPYMDCPSPECTKDSDCESKNTDWTSWTYHRETRKVYKCDTDTYKCVEYTTEYRCEAGSYGYPSADRICNICTLPGTSPAGATSESQCCISAGQTGSDSKGTYRYKSDCCYQ